MPAPWMKTTSGRSASNARPPVPAWTRAPATVKSMPRSVLLRGAERLAQVGDDVVPILQAVREEHHVLAEPRPLQVLGGHLLVRGSGREDHHGHGIPDVGAWGGEGAG